MGGGGGARGREEGGGEVGRRVSGATCDGESRSGVVLNFHVVLQGGIFYKVLLVL